MKKSLILSMLIIMLMFILLASCSANEVLNQDESIINESTESNNPEDFLLARETVKITYDEGYNYEGQELAEYVIVRDYFYNENNLLEHTEVNSYGFIHVYGYEENNSIITIVETKELNNANDPHPEYGLEYYKSRIGELIESLKDPGNEPEISENIKVSPNGKIIEETVDYNNGQSAINRYYYDDEKRLVEIVYNDDDYWKWTVIFTYDEKDRVVKVTYGGGEMGFGETNYIYNENDLLIRIHDHYRTDTMQGVAFEITFEYMLKK